MDEARIQQVFLQRMMGCGALQEKETLMLYSQISKDCNGWSNGDNLMRY